MGSVVGLVLGVGLLLIWTAATVPRGASRPRRALLRARLDAAGLPTTAPSTVVAASVSAGAVVLVAVLLVSRTAPVALVFAVMAAWAPFAWVGARVRRR